MISPTDSSESLTASRTTSASSPLTQRPPLASSLPSLAASLWALVGVVVWCSALPPEAPVPEQAAWLTTLALLIGLVGLGIRRPRWASFAARGQPPLEFTTGAARQLSALELPQNSRTDSPQFQWTWACAAIGNVYLLGWIALSSPSLLAAMPALLVMLMLEAIAWPWAPQDYHRLARNILSSLPQLTQSSQQAIAAHPSLDSSVPGEAPPGQSQGLEESLIAPPLSQQWQRQTTLFGEMGRGCWQEGSVRLQLASQQRTQTLTIGFSPAFSVPPNVELETEVASSEESSNGTEDEADQDASGIACEAQVEHITPAGMRVVIKRSSIAGTQPLVEVAGWLLWHASEEPESENADCHESEDESDRQNAPGPLP